MIRKKSLPGQDEFWVKRDSIRAGRAKTFYDGLVEHLDSEGFGDFVRELCAPFYHSGSGGRPPIDPEVYFKMLMVGYFEKLGSERGIASRCEDSLAVRRFLRYDLTEATPDHSSLSVIRKRLPREVYEEVFAFSLRALRKSGLLTGEKLGLDSTTMEADASMEKLVRRDDGMSYADYVAGLAAAEGIDPEDKGAVAAFDRKRPGRKTSNEEWVSPADPDACFGPRKDGAWDMLHKVENVVDLDSGAIVSTEIQPATKGDADGMAAHLETGFLMVEYTASQVDDKEDGHDDHNDRNDHSDGDGGGDPPKRYGVGDKGYHKNSELTELVAAGICPVIAEPSGKGPSRTDEAAAEAFATNLANRRSEDGRAMMKARAEKVERSFQHLLDHGGGRRTTLRGHLNIGKRLLAMAFVFNVAIYRRKACGYGTLKQALAGNRWEKPFFAILRAMEGALRRIGSPMAHPNFTDPLQVRHYKELQAFAALTPRHAVFLPISTVS
ncbi:MAG: transposase [Verrucomicrobiales bacterium]|nr:transposase [Verrucomicrobiales bacterium]